MKIEFDEETLKPILKLAAAEVLAQRLESAKIGAAGQILVDKRGAAEILSVSVSTVDRLRKEGLPYVKIDGKVLFRPTALEAWAAAREEISVSKTDGTACQSA